MNVVFTDGIANVRLIDGVVRFDFVRALCVPNE